MKKYCNKCGMEKPLTEFYKNRTAKDNLQNKCKDCCKKNNKEFREKNPTYYWGTENSYFNRCYEETIEYQNNLYKKTDLCKIFRIDLPEDKIYIGVTQRNIGRAMNSIKQDHIRFRRHSNTDTSLLHKFLIKYPQEICIELIKSLYLIDEFTGTKTELIRKQIQIIKDLRRDGKEVLYRNLL